MLRIFKMSKINKVYIRIVSFIAGILGLLSSLIYLMNNILITKHHHHYLITSGASKFICIACTALVFSILGLVGAMLVYKNIHIAGILMCIAAVGGVFTIRIEYVLPAILFVSMGAVCLMLPKDKLIQIY